MYSLSWVVECIKMWLNHVFLWNDKSFVSSFKYVSHPKATSISKNWRHCFVVVGIHVNKFFFQKFILQSISKLIFLWISFCVCIFKLISFFSLATINGMWFSNISQHIHTYICEHTYIRLLRNECGSAYYINLCLLGGLRFNSSFQ